MKKHNVTVFILPNCKHVWYLTVWYLTVNTTKTVSSYFHLNNREAEDTKSIGSLNNQLPSDQFPTYLEVTLDRSLSYKKHIGNLMQKLKKRTNLIRKISGTSWGAPQAVLRTSAMALCYSVAEYAAPAWAQTHTYTHKSFWGFAFATAPLSPLGEHLVFHCF